MSSKNKFFESAQKSKIFDIKKEIAKLLREHINLNEEKIESLLEVPPSSELGDYAFPCFVLTKQYKKAPQEIAKDIVSELKKTKMIDRTEAVGAYINFFLNKRLMAEQVIKQVIKIRENYGKQEIKKKKEKKKIMVEFSQANTHKAFHIGHIRGTSLGESISRILEFSGNEVIRANYQGDTGMHIAKWLWCYLNFHKKEKLKNEESWIAGIYVDAVKRLTENQEFQTQVDEINRKLESKEDKKLNKLWEKTRKISLEAFEKIYSDLNTKFDVYYFEKDMEEKGKKIAKQLLKRKIAKISYGATIVNLEKYNLGVWVLLRKDGTVLYSSKDLALAEEKFKKNDIEKSLYIIGNAQKLYFQQLLKTLELSNFAHFKDIRAIHFEEVRLPQGAMSSRTGQNILYSEFKKEISDYAKQEIKKRFPKISKKQLEKRALAISIAAIKYDMLKQDASKPLVFVKEEALNFEGNSGPYLQYSYARASSILKKAKKSKKHQGRIIKALENEEIEIIKKISQFQEQVEKASKNLDPSLITNYSFDLAQIFNEFYHSCPVIGSKQENFRLKLVQAFRITIKNALWLLGIEAIEEM